MGAKTTREIQKLIGAKVDGIAGPTTKALLWDYCDEEKLLKALPKLKRSKAAIVAEAKQEEKRLASIGSGDPVLHKITRILSIFEMGKPEFKWGDTYWYRDGRGGKMQATLSMGFTEGGALQKVLDRYIANKGKHRAEVQKYRPRVGKYTLKNQRSDFSALMKKCGKDPIMQEAQLYVFQTSYLAASERFCVKNGFTTPLARLVFADSKLHSGSPALPFLRKRFPERVPAEGGDERTYVRQYSEVRRDWLAGHSRKILHATAKRPRYYIYLMDKGKWGLESPITLEGHIIC